MAWTCIWMENGKIFQKQVKYHCLEAYSHEQGTLPSPAIEQNVEHFHQNYILIERGRWSFSARQMIFFAIEALVAFWILSHEEFGIFI